MKIVIVGGGCAGTAAAWELSRPGSGNQVTLYQEGWRLGGKGASGRGPFGRIEEHGLHLWLGYYENAFRMLREAHAELAERGISFPPLAGAFEPVPQIGVFGDNQEQMSEWIATFPDEEGEPGDGTPIPSFRDSASIGPRVVRLLLHLLRSMRAESDEGLTEEMGRIVNLAQLEPLAGRSANVNEVQLLTRFVALRELLRPILQSVTIFDARVRSLAEVVDVILATTIGYFQERLEPGWYARLNQFDFREWLNTQDLVLPTSTASPLLASLYNLAFAYEYGDASRPKMAAGVALECAIRTFLTYKRAPFWRMKVGMGDAVFAPMYLALRARGVEFKFFHRLRKVVFADLPVRDTHAQLLLAPGRVESLDFDEQVRLRKGQPYEPLVAIKEFLCWPAQPLVDQLEVPGSGEFGRYEDPADQSAAGQLTLHEGEAFDHVILALGADSLPEVAGDLLRDDPRWSAMAAAGRTVGTQAMQLWLTKSVEELGWCHGPAAMTGLAPGLDTWADMSHLAEREAWPKQPGSILYFCGTVFEEPGSDVLHQAKENAARLLTTELARLLPGACDAKGFRRELLIGDDGEYQALNIRGSARYSQSLPGSISDRISPFDESISNLKVAGDWTDCGLNVGCVEAAVSSGIIAAAALTGHLEPGRLQGHGYLRPWFRESPKAAPIPSPSSDLDARLLVHAADLQSAVDAELDRFDEGLFDAALLATHPWRARTWATDAVPLLQFECPEFGRVSILTGIELSDGTSAKAFSASWATPVGPNGSIELRANERGILVADLFLPTNAVGGRSLHHLLVCAANGLAVLLLEIRVNRE